MEIDFALQPLTAEVEPRRRTSRVDLLVHAHTIGIDPDLFYVAKTAALEVTLEDSAANLYYLT